MARSKFKGIKNTFRQSFIDKRNRGLIENTQVDYERLRDRPLAQEQVDNIHKKYSITYYSSRHDFDEHYSKAARTAVIADIRASHKEFKTDKAKQDYITNQVNERLDKQWEFYQHRELLIQSGQYDEIRTEQHRQQYIEHLRLANVDADVIENINRLTPEQWARLITYPSVDPSTPTTRILPQMTDIYSSTYQYDSDKYDVVKQEIQEAFKDAGLEYIENKKAKGQTEVLKRRKFRSLATAYYEGRLEITRKANGAFSVPFIGSTDSKKTGRVTKDFISYLDKVSDDFDLDED